MLPDANAELFLYQTLVGIWPAPRPSRRSDDVPDKQWRAAALDRLKQYMIKAVREAKLSTSWTNPDEGYERALTDFVTALMQFPEDDQRLRLQDRVEPRDRRASRPGRRRVRASERESEQRDPAHADDNRLSAPAFLFGGLR